jgi:hypothetical protein
MSDSSVILENWEQIKELLVAIEPDLHKNAKGNKAAGVRARKALRELKKHAGDLVKVTLEVEKTE